ncbi:glycerol-3-phosphate acyltransferase [Desulfosarcina sp.]|uniref:glycerol-3-phosphate acyltransferase n=1 Tax=Desulfosarcina sp. TaxID=2027861 RepID=UPI00356B139C
MHASRLLTFTVLFVSAYAAGSVNFSILAFRFTGRDDPRRHGSGNPGATNVYRQAGLGWAAAVLLLDVGRAVGVALVAQSLLPFWQVPWVGLGLILGNRFPCFHGFKGGKGVANYLGFTLAVTPVWAAVGALAWGAAHLIWRAPFMSSFAMVIILAYGTTHDLGTDWRAAVGAAVTALFIVACHHDNIRQRWGGKQ